jgi:peroxiredoxin
MTMHLSSREGAPGRRVSAGQLITVLVVAGMVLAAAGYLFLAGTSRRTPASAAIDGLPGGRWVKRPAPDFTFRTLDGRERKLSLYRGKVLVLDFWASWCPPCRDEIPVLADLARTYAGQGVEIVGLSLEDPERDRETVRAFLEKYKVPYTIGFAPNEMFAAFAGEGDVPIPQTFIFDRDGLLREHLIGFDPVGDARKLKETVARLAASD